MRLLAAVFTDQQDAAGALARLESGGGHRPWLADSAIASTLNLPLAGTLLPGEQLVGTYVPRERMEEAVEQLNRVGAPAIFVLPEIPDAPADVPAPASGQPLTTAVETLAGQHERFGPNPRRGVLYELLDACERRLEQVREDILEAARLDHTLTAAADWLLDNGYLFEVHIAEVRANLPRQYYRILPAGSSTNAETPRIFELAREMLRLTDFVISTETVVEAVAAYQSVHPLTMAELWALPQMIRLALIEGLSRIGSAVDRSQQLRELSYFWANRLVRAARADQSVVEKLLDDLQARAYALDPNFVTSLTEQLREEPGAMVALQRLVEERSHESIGEIVRREHQEETADRVSIANAVSSLRQLGRMDFKAIFEGASAVETILRSDPSGVYQLSDFSTRDRCRHAVEQISRTGPLDEFEVARRAIKLASAGGSELERNVAFYLVGSGREKTEAECESRPLAAARLLRFARRNATPLYLAGILLITAGFVGVLLTLAWTSGLRSPAALVLLGFLGGFPFSELAIQIVNALIFRFFPPDELPRLSLEDGIPAGSATLVVVPMMLGSVAGVRREAQKLEVRYLGNTEPHLYFALLADFADADARSTPEDLTLLAESRALIAALNDRYGAGKFYFLHREREWSESEQVWMGRERKRGKIEELNAWLHEEPSGIIATESLPEAIRYVITLDADTQLPPEAARRLVATLSHPLNQMRLAADGRHRAEGYSIVQPRVSIGLPGATATRFTRIFADANGTDPYCQSVSDVYQDLFREGIFLGKAIYDVRAFHAILKERFPEATLLSHDLIEGAHVGVASASGIELFENLPSDYSSYSRRQHRWIRGDWQIAPWIRGKVPDASGTRQRNPLPAIARWRILDNLRRSLTPPATVLLLLWGWFVSQSPGLWTFLIAATVTLPGLAPLSERLAKRLSGSAQNLRGAWEELLRIAVTLALLPHQAWISLDAIVRVLHRRFVSKRRLLEWQTAEQADSRAGDHHQRTVFECAVVSGVSLVLLLMLAAKNEFWTTLFFLLPWILSPAVVVWLSRRTAGPIRALDEKETAFLSKMARLTWRFFDDLVGPEDHWLPPDNTQLALRVEVAHRTSPTNIGLWLTSALAAHDFGFITADDLVTRCAATTETLASMERYEGHWLNWYDTRTLDPLNPRYVSSVDSGNLLASFWVLDQGLAGIETDPLLTPAILSGLAASVLVLEQIFDGDHSVDGPLKALKRQCGRVAGAHEIPDRLGASAAPVRRLAATRRWQSPESSAERDYWIEKLEAQLNSWIQYVKRYLPWLETLAAAPDPFLRGIHPDLVAVRKRVLLVVPSLADLDERRLPLLEEMLSFAPHAREDQQKAWLEQLSAEYQASSESARETRQRIAGLRARIRAMAASVDMGFLYDPKRSLFAIGYQVGSPLEFGSHYDLLASECRLASIVAIAKGDVPVKHWLALGRPYVSDAEGQNLLSWNGTMFEFLMPMVYTQAFENSFLAASCQLAVQKQIEYANQKGIPWGISEAAYSALDANKIYQYRAFGIPPLALKEGLENDLVVSPYSSFLSLMVLPKESVYNLEGMAEQGMSGPMGLYESLDYTREKTRRGGRGVVVYTYMAHHQGMSLLAMNNAMNDSVMQKRFHADPRVQAFESLLFERVPARKSQLRRTRADVPFNRILSEPEPGPRTWQEDSPLPQVNLLGNGRYSLVVTSAGSGYSRWKQFDVTSWRADTTLDSSGCYFYVRDRKSGALWSATHQPLAGDAGTFTCNFSADRAEFIRWVTDLETITSICVSPEADAEVRRLTFSNHGSRARSLEVTSYCELALAPHAAERSHPAFSKLFVETEVLPDGRTLIAHRRLRSPEEPEVWVAHMLTDTAGSSGLQWETSRMAFLGRGRSVKDPAALHGELSCSTGTVLDPVFSLRCRFALPPRGQAELCFVTLAAESREALLALVDRFRHHDAIPRSFEAAWTQAQLEFRYLGIKASTAHRYQELLSPMIYPYAGMRPAAPRLLANKLGQSGLWVHSLSGDLPILLVTLSDSRGVGLVRDVLLAHAYWRMRGFSADVVIVDQEPYSYEQPLRQEIVRIIDAHRSHPGTQPGGAFLLDWHLLTEDARALLLAAAHVVLAGGRGNLAQQLTATPDAPTPMPLLEADASRHDSGSSSLPFLELPYFNGYGGFTQDGREYAIYLKPHENTPLPWSNVIAGPEFGTVVTESGLGFTWFGNSQANRLTPWHNDPVRDPQSEIVYIRDEESGAVWTPTALPIREETAYRARHGQGYTVYEHNSHGIRQEMTVFVPLDEHAPVKILLLRLQNEDSHQRTCSVTWYAEWVLGVTREENQRHVQTNFDVDSATLMARNVWQPSFGSRVAFQGMYPLPQSWTGDRSAFLGRNGRHSMPDALRRARLDSRTGAGLDPVGAMQSRVRLQPGETATVVCVIGQGASVEEARALATRYRDPQQAAAALERTKAWWDRRLDTLQVRLPVLSAQMLVNRWLPYQVLSCRFWARSAFYQSGGAFGFRDQLQDSMAFVYWAPELARQHILATAARQFPEGDVQHWWHPETGAGPRTRCSDDMLWLPYVVTHYVRVTGDESILRERVPFIDGPELEPGQDERLFVAAEDPTRGLPLIDHCLRAIERGHRLGEHGLPLFGNGDWNDGMNRVGHEGRGESVWVAWFLAAVMREFAPFTQNGSQLRSRADELVRNIEAHGWDGAWYLRGFFDDGTPLGSRDNEEARIDSLTQSWAVLAGGSDPLRARAAIVSAVEHLVRKDTRQVLLFTPGFDHSRPHPGYIMGYPPGIRENGGQYTHGSLWLPLALARMGLGVDAVSLMQLMNPVEASRDPDAVARYAGEPYVSPADVYASPRHAGRCGWTWYTGSAAWMYRVWLEGILGFRLTGDRLVLDPVLPAGWDDAEITYRHGEAVYRIRVAAGPERMIRHNGRPVEVIYLDRAAAEHEVVVTVPAAVGGRVRSGDREAALVQGD